MRISYLINSPSGYELRGGQPLNATAQELVYRGRDNESVFSFDADDIDSVDSVLVDGEAVESANYTVDKNKRHGNI